jgi:hypothetical protein
VKRTVPCILVAYHGRLKPVRVPLDGWEETDLEPWFYSPSYRRQMAEEFKSWGPVARDEKGRFA